MALAMILVVRRLRGWTSYTDAFFPLLLLQWGSQITWSRHGSSRLYCTDGRRRSRAGDRRRAGDATDAPDGDTRRNFVALLPLCSAAGLLYLPPLLLWMAYSAVVSWRSAEPRASYQCGDPGRNRHGRRRCSVFRWIRSRTAGGIPLAYTARLVICRTSWR